MNFDTVILAAVVDELSGVALGARVDKVSQPEPLELILTLYKDGARSNLLISADPNSARIHFVTGRSRPNPQTAPAFCMLLRKHLDGGSVIGINEPLGFCERVVNIAVRTQSKETVNLIIEVMGRQSNVILVSESGIILGSAKRVTKEMSRLREVRTGIPYIHPPRQAAVKRDPMEPLAAVGLPSAHFSNSEEAEKWLMSSFKGVGTLLAREAVLRSLGDNLSGEAIWFGLNELLNSIRLAEFAPVVYGDNNGRTVGAYPLPLKSIPELQQRRTKSMSEALEQAFSSQLVDDTFDREKSALISALRRATKSNTRQLLDIQEGLVNSEQSDYIRQNGELLLANIGRVAPGTAEVSVDDYFSTDLDAKRNIALDAKLTIHENAERYFKRFQKARDSKVMLLQRQEQLKSASRRIDEAISGAETASTVREIQTIAEQIASEIPKGQTTDSHEISAKPAYDGHKIKSMKSPDGWEILVGENSTSNDFLTTKVASPSDIWLHARAVPSAHAVIRSQNRPASVSTAAILLAAEQVARRSQAKHAGLVSVDYTLKKYVRKPRGSAPGQVTYTNERTIDVIASED